MILARFLVGIMSAAALSGCVAAVIPVAAGGIIGRKTMHRHDPAGAAPAAVASQPSAPAGDAAGATIAAVPDDPVAMRPGQVYAGRLPGPDGAADHATPAAAASVRITPATWGDVLHFAAGQPNAVADSVLLARHVAGAEPHWVACTGKPRAVIVDTAANGNGQGDDYVDALRTIGFAIVFTSDRAQAADPYFGRAAKPSHQLATGDAFVQLSPGAEGAARARIAARYCVLAIAGRTAADFPDGMLPGTANAIPGWFVIAAS